MARGFDLVIVWYKDPVRSAGWRYFTDLRMAYEWRDLKKRTYDYWMVLQNIDQVRENAALTHWPESVKHAFSDFLSYYDRVMVQKGF